MNIRSFPKRRVISESQMQMGVSTNSRLNERIDERKQTEPISERHEGFPGT